MFDTYNGEHYPGQIFRDKRTGERWYIATVVQGDVKGKRFKSFQISNCKITIIVQQKEFEENYEPDPGPWTR